MNQQFHPSYIRSHRYNYTVDYFELRAQPGRYSYVGGGDSLWGENIPGVNVYPLNQSNAVVIGGVSRRSNEMLRVLGTIDSEGLVIGGSYIKEVGGELVFFDATYNSEVSLSDIFSSFWTRTSTYLTPKNTGDSLLLGQSTGEALKRLQIKSEAGDGSSYIISGKNSSDAEVFYVNDQGNVFLEGALVWSDLEYIFSTSTTLDFNVEGISSMKVYKNKVEGPGSSWMIRPTNPYYSKVGATGDGIGFPTLGETAIYSSNSIVFQANISQVKFPQTNWIFSGKNLLRVAQSGNIELGKFVFDENDMALYFNPNIWIKKDVAGNMLLADDFNASGVTLTELMAMASVTTYWDRDSFGVLSPKTTGDLLKIPSLSGTGNRAVFVTNNGTLVTGSILYHWDQNDTLGLLVPIANTHSVIIGKNNYTTASTYKFEVWANNTSMIIGASDSEIFLARDTRVASGKKINFEDTNTQIYEDVNHNLKLKDAIAGEFSLKQITGYVHTQGIASDTWNIAHGLNKQAVIVQVFDMNGKEYKASIEHTDNNNTVISLGFALSGYAQFR